MAASVKMRTRFARKVPAGTQCNAFGYPGTVNEHGHVVVDVPPALVEVEKSAGRLVPLDSTAESKETATATETTPKAEATTKK